MFTIIENVLHTLETWEEEAKKFNLTHKDLIGRIQGMTPKYSTRHIDSGEEFNRLKSLARAYGGSAKILENGICKVYFQQSSAKEAILNAAEMTVALHGLEYQTNTVVETWGPIVIEIRH